MATPTRSGPRKEVKTELTREFENSMQKCVQHTRHSSPNPLSCCCHSGHQGETTNSFLATLASSSSEEMEVELQERVESSQKQACHVVEIYECLKSTVDQLKAELNSGAGKIKEGWF